MTPGLPAPFDHELAMLEAGHRRLVKREFARRDALDALRARGHRVALAGGAGYGLDAASPDVTLGAGDHVTAFIGDAGAVARALRLEETERNARGRTRRDAMRALGDLLGYPACCVAAYLDQPSQSESACFARILAPEQPRDGLPATNNLFLLDHQLISHFPCRLDCEASAHTGALALDVLRATAPAESDALGTLLASPITVWDRLRFLVEHPTLGQLLPGDLTTEPRLHEHPGYQAFRAALPDRPPAGARLTWRPVSP